MKMEQIECSETSAYKIQTPGNYPKENIQDIFCLPRLSKTAVEPAQLLYNEYRGCLPGVKRLEPGVDYSPHLGPGVRMSGAIPQFPLCNYMACYLYK
jgi:hypothetical protein